MDFKSPIKFISKETNITNTVKLSLNQIINVKPNYNGLGGWIFNGKILPYYR